MYLGNPALTKFHPSKGGLPQNLRNSESLKQVQKMSVVL